MDRLYAIIWMFLFDICVEIHEIGFQGKGSTPTPKTLLPIQKRMKFRAQFILDKVKVLRVQLGLNNFFFVN